MDEKDQEDDGDVLDIGLSDDDLLEGSFAPSRTGSPAEASVSCFGSGEGISGGILPQSKTYIENRAGVMNEGSVRTPFLPPTVHPKIPVSVRGTGWRGNLQRSPRPSARSWEADGMHGLRGNGRRPRQRPRPGMQFPPKYIPNHQPLVGAGMPPPRRPLRPVWDPRNPPPQHRLLAPPALDSQPDYQLGPNTRPGPFATLPPMLPPGLRLALAHNFGRTGEASRAELQSLNEQANKTQAERLAAEHNVAHDAMPPFHHASILQRQQDQEIQARNVMMQFPPPRGPQVLPPCSLEENTRGGNFQARNVMMQFPPPRRPQGLPPCSREENNRGGHFQKSLAMVAPTQRGRAASHRIGLVMNTHSDWTKPPPNFIPDSMTARQPPLANRCVEIPRAAPPLHQLRVDFGGGGSHQTEEMNTRLEPYHEAALFSRPTVSQAVSIGGHQPGASIMLVQKDQVTDYQGPNFQPKDYRPNSYNSGQADRPTPHPYGGQQNQHTANSQTADTDPAPRYLAGNSTVAGDSWVNAAAASDRQRNQQRVTNSHLGHTNTPQNSVMSSNQQSQGQLQSQGNKAVLSEVLKLLKSGPIMDSVVGIIKKQGLNDQPNSSDRLAASPEDYHQSQSQQLVHHAKWKSKSSDPKSGDHRHSSKSPKPSDHHTPYHQTHAYRLPKSNCSIQQSVDKHSSCTDCYQKEKPCLRCYEKNVRIQEFRYKKNCREQSLKIIEWERREKARKAHAANWERYIVRNKCVKLIGVGNENDNGRTWTQYGHVSDDCECKSVCRQSSSRASCYPGGGSDNPKSRSRGSHERRSRGRGSHEHRSRSRGSHEHRSRSRGSHEHRSRSRGSHERRSRSRGSHEHRSRSRGSHEHRSRSRGSHERRSRSRGSREHRSCSRGSREHRSCSRGSREHKSCSRGSHEHRSRSRGSHERRSRSRGSHKHRSRSRGSHKRRSQSGESRDRTLKSDMQELVRSSMQQAAPDRRQSTDLSVGLPLSNTGPCTEPASNGHSEETVGNVEEMLDLHLSNSQAKKSNLGPESKQLGSINLAEAKASIDGRIQTVESSVGQSVICVASSSQPDFPECQEDEVDEEKAFQQLMKKQQEVEQELRRMMALRMKKAPKSDKMEIK